MKSLFKTVFLIIIFTGITRLAGFLFRIWLSREIGAEALGLYQISFSIFMVLLTLVSSGIPLVISRQTANYEAKKDHSNSHKIATSGLVVSIVISIILCVVFFIFQKPLSFIFTDDRCMKILLVLLPALIFSSIYSTLRGNLWGRNKYISVCSAELFEQIIRIIICFIMLGGIWDIADGAIVAGISLSIACVFSSIFVLILYLKSGGRFKKPNSYKEIIRSSAPITGVRIASSLIQPVISLIIPLRLMHAGYSNSQALSLFGVATGMTMPLLFIPMTIIGSLSTALIPDLGAAVAKQDESHIQNRVTTSIIFALFVSSLLVPLYIGAGQNIGYFFYGNLEAGTLLCSAAWIMIPMSLTNISSSILNAVGLETKSFKNYILGAILMLLCLWFLPQFVGVKALIWAMGACFTTSAILNLRMIKKQVCNKLKLKTMLVKMILFVIPTGAVTWFTTSLLSSFLPLFFNLAISCSIGAIFFILLCLIFNVFEIHSVVVWIKENNPIKSKIQKKKV